MKVVIDNKIPYIREAMEALADEVVYLPGKEITASVVRDADALITRTRTQCNRQLLEGSKVRFIGTATIGFDHIDTEYCREAGITWSNCPGCNAGAVEQYLHSVLLLLQQEKHVELKDACLGIVGVGHVGSHILSLAERLGMRILLNDPPRADHGEEGFVSLETLARECDIITFHTPLERNGEYRTFAPQKAVYHQYLTGGSSRDRGHPGGPGQGTHRRSRTGCLGERAPHQPGTARQGIYRYASHRRLFGRRKGQCHPYGTRGVLPVLRQGNEFPHRRPGTAASGIRQRRACAPTADVQPA